MNNRFRTLAITTTAVLAIGTLGACSSVSDTATPTPTVTVTATPTPVAPLDREAPSGYTAEALYVETYEAEFGSIDSTSEGILIDLGYEVCRSFDSGMTFWEIGQTGIDAGMDEYETGFIIGIAAGAFCPEYTDDVMDAAQAGMAGDYA